MIKTDLWVLSTDKDLRLLAFVHFVQKFKLNWVSNNKSEKHSHVEQPIYCICDFLSKEEGLNESPLFEFYVWQTIIVQLKKNCSLFFFSHSGQSSIMSPERENRIAHTPSSPLMSAISLHCFPILSQSTGAIGWCLMAWHTK